MPGEYLVSFTDQLRVGEMLVGIAPEALTYFGMEYFGEAFRQAVGKRP